MDRGQLIPKGPDKWQLRVYLGLDPTTRKRKYVAKAFRGSESEARKALTKLLGDSDQGKVRPKTDLTVAGWMAEWLETKHDIGPKTRLSYEARIKYSIAPFLGPMKLSDLTTRRLQHWITELKGAGQGPRTIQFAAGVLAQSLTAAMNAGLTGTNPLTAVVLPRLTKKEVKVWSPLETRTFLDWSGANDPLHPIWTLLLTCGLRPGEVLALKWADVTGDTLQIRRALQEVTKGKWEVLETKTAGSRRSVSLGSECLSALRSQKMKSGLWSEWIFPDSMSLDFVRKRFYAAQKKAGVSFRLSLYGCRHTHITHLLMAGVHPKVAADRAGHSNITLTLNTYSHVLPSMQQAAVEAHAELLRKAT